MTQLRLVLFAVAVTSFASLAETPCQDCWNDSCKEFKGLIPKCAGGARPGPARPKPPAEDSPGPGAPTVTACTTVPECNALCSGGNMGACVALGSMFENGIGTREDKSKAEYWYDFACQAGFRQGCLRLKPYQEERARRDAEEKKAEAERRARERQEEAERKKREAEQREQERLAEVERKKQEAEERKRAEQAEAERKKQAEADRKKQEAEAKAREAREKQKQLDWVFVGPLRVAKTETTALQYAACVGAKQCKPAGGTGRCSASKPLDDLQPQTCVDWAQAAKFCEWAGGRLPSSAEWVALATNGGKTSYPWGNDEPSATRAVYKASAPALVGSAPGGASERGLLDLAGNVWEWVSDDDGPGRHQVRGGSWDFPEDNLKPAQKFGYGAQLRVDNLGFRCVRSEPGPVAVAVEPVGAALFIDGIPVGNTLWSGALAPGAHKASATLAQHLPAVQAFVVKAAGETMVRLTLKPDPRGVPGRLEVASTPPGARVRVDGAEVGTTPWAGEATQGPHAVDVALEGFEPVSRQVEVTLKQPEVLRLELVKKLVATAVTVVSEPPGAAVTEGKVSHGVTPATPTLAPGKHELLLQLEGYAPAKVSVTVPLAAALAPVKLERLPVDFAVRSTPLGAAVSIDGRAVGKTPWRGKVTPGPHEVTLELAGYVTAKEPGAAPGIVNATLSPVPVGFALGLEVWPAGLQVKVDGKPVAPVDGVFLVPVGKHVVDVTAPGFKSARLPVAVTKAEVARVPLTLVPGVDLPPRGLVVLSTPPGAEVRLAGRAVGVTPFVDAALPDGAHEVTVSREGYEPATARVEVKKGAPTEHAVTLVPAAVAVAIESRPDGAQVFLDGETRGVTPLMLRLKPGTYRVYLTREGHQTVNETKELAVGSAPTWAWPLAPLATAASAPGDAGVPAGAVGVSPGEALRTLLADRSVEAETKRARLLAYAETSEDLSSFVAATTPAELRDELCLAHAGKVRTVRYAARAVDGFGDPLEAQLLVNGKALGALPFDGALPWCVRTLQAKDAEGHLVTRAADKPLDAITLNSDTYEFPGRRRRVSFTAFFDANVMPLLLEGVALEDSEGDLKTFNHGFGVRFDYWGKLFHLSLAAKASQLFRNSIFNDGSLPYVPLGDLFVGLTFAAGSDQVRYRFAVDVGVANLVTPGVRLVNALSIGERFFITLTLDGQFVPDVFVPRLAVGTPFAALWMMGGTFGLGVGF